MIERIAGKDYTTLTAIEDMRALCRVPQKAPDSGFGPKNETPMGRSASARYGSSETDLARSARAALQKIARAPSVPSANTSPTNIKPNRGRGRHPSEILIADVLAIYLKRRCTQSCPRGRNQAARASRSIPGGPTGRSRT